MKIRPIIIIRVIGAFAMLSSPMTRGLGLIAGIGLILRTNWGKWMGLIFFGMWSFIIFAVIIANIFVHEISGFGMLISMIIFGLLCGYCFWLLTRKEIISEFARKK